MINNEEYAQVLRNKTSIIVVIMKKYVLSAMAAKIFGIFLHLTFMIHASCVSSGEVAIKLF